MKITKEQAAENRERIIETAARLFRERGFAGIGVADLMKEAGMTHGGFYGHFESKDDLIAEASARALAGSLALLVNRSEQDSGDPLSGVTRAYLTAAHRDDPGTGCLIAAVGSEVSRQGRATRRVVSDHIDAAVELLTKLVPGKSNADRRRDAIGTYATLIGAMVMARAVDDREFSLEILEASRASAKSRKAIASRARSKAPKQQRSK